MDIITENLTTEIKKNIASIKLPGSFKLISIDKYIFPDEYPINTHLDEGLFILQSDKQKIGLFQFGVKRINTRGQNVTKQNTVPTITLDFVQGIKQKNSNVKFPNGWQEVIVNTFIMACVPVIEKNSEIKIRYREFIPERGGLSNYQEITKRVKDLENECRALERSTDHELRKLINVKQKKLQIEISLMRFIAAIRDRYFDKEGYLNPKRERVNSIFKTYAENKKLAVKRVLELREKKKIQKQKAIKERRNVKIK